MASGLGFGRSARRHCADMNNHPHEKSQPRYCVVGGADSLEVLTIPNTAEGVDELRAKHDGDLWCPVKLGGCGARMLPKAQRRYPERQNYFQHWDASDCSGADPVSVEHFLIQCELVDWLTEQGHEARIETNLASGARADVTVNTSFGTFESLEVQLSPQGVDAFASRTERYRQDLNRVTWLYGPKLLSPAEAAAKTDGVSFQIDITDGGEVLVGVVDFLGQLSGLVPLSSYTYGPAGFESDKAAASRKAFARAQEEARKRSGALAAVHERMDPLVYPWVQHCAGSLKGACASLPASLRAHLKGNEIPSLEVLDARTHDLGVLNVLQPSQLQRAGFCPLSGLPLFQSEPDSLLQHSITNPWGSAVTVRVATDASTDHLVLPAGTYELARNVTWFGVPVGSSAELRGVIHFIGKPKSRQFPGIDATDKWAPIAPHTLLFDGVILEPGRVTRKGDRRHWEITHGQVIDQNTCRVVGSDRGTELSILLPVSANPARDVPPMQALASQSSLAPRKHLGAPRYLSASSLHFTNPGPAALRVKQGAVTPLPSRPQLPWTQSTPEGESVAAIRTVVETEYWPALRDSFMLPEKFTPARDEELQAAEYARTVDQAIRTIGHSW